MAMGGGNAAKKVLADIRGYLQDNLPVDGNLISKLQGRNLLDEYDASQLRAAVSKGRTDGVCGLLDYMHSYYTEEMLETFCVFLEEHSKPAKPVLLTVATRIREKMKQYQPHPNQPAESRQDVSGPSGTGPLPMESSTPPPPETTRDDVPGPSGTGNTSSEIPTQEEELFYPFPSDELEEAFSDIALDTWKQINHLDEENFESMRTFLAIILKPKVPSDAEPPDIPKDKEKLKKFLISKWDMLNVHVFKKVIRQLEKHKPTSDQSLTKQLEVYESKLTKEVPVFLEKCKIKKIPVKKIPCHSSLAVKIALTPSELMLSRIFQLKEFFVRVFHIPEALFKGFSTGSTVLYFSIPEDSVWCLPACLHPSNLPQLEEWKVVSLSVEGMFTIDLVEKRIVDVLDKPSAKLISEEYQFKDKIAQMEKALRYYEQVKPDAISEVESVGLEPLTKEAELEPPDHPDVKLKLETADPNWELGFKREVKPDPISEEEGLELEPLTKKPTLEPPDYEIVKPKLETADPNWELGFKREKLQDRKDVTSNVLNCLHVYLQENLPVDVSFFSGLQDKHLLAKENADRLRAAVETKGGTSGVDGLLDYMSFYYDEEMLETFCVFLEEHSKPAKPVLLTVATRIREEMKQHQPHPTQLTESQQSDPSGPRGTGPLPMESSTPQPSRTSEHDVPVTSGTGPLPMESSTPPPSETTWDDVPGPSGTGPLPMESSTPPPSETTQDDVPRLSGTDPPTVEPSPPNTAIESEPGDIFYPVISELDEDFTDLAIAVLEQIKSLDTGKLTKLRKFLANLLRPKVPPSSPPPYVPEEYDDLEHFLISKWDPLQIRILQQIVKKHLKIDSLSERLKEYEKLLKRETQAFLSECKTKKVPYKRLHRYSTVAVTIDCSPSEVSLSRILELKEYFVRQLGIREELFKGFRES